MFMIMSSRRTSPFQPYHNDGYQGKGKEGDTEQPSPWA
jgi:hypothetical protein